MQFEFSEDQEILRDQARKFLDKEDGRAAARKTMDERELYDMSLWRGMSELGWQGVAIPETYGGLGIGYLELCVIAEELGRSLAPVPFSSSIYLVSEAILAYGSEAQKQKLLPGFATGERVGALALSEGPGAAPWHAIKTTATNVSGGSFALTGVKTPVMDGEAANLLLVTALFDGKLQLFVVDPDQDGVSRSFEPGIDDSRPLARIELKGATATRLGGDGQISLRDLLNRAAVLIAFEQLGGAGACLQMAVDYAKQRVAFGRLIGSLQAIKHRLADMYTELELARSNCYFGAWALSTNDQGLDEAASIARLSASNAFFYCAKENIQVHGGIGFTWDLDGHLFYRRSKLLSSVIGGQHRWREYLMQALETKKRAKATERAHVA